MLPLQGIRVIEFCNVAAGPFCGMLLADMGADVIKVEHPKGGDSMRQWPPIHRRLQREFRLAQPQQALRYARPQGSCRQGAREGADPFRRRGDREQPSGVMDRLGLGYGDFKPQKPKLVYCSISAFGQEGPRSEEGGFDLTMQAMSGVMSVTGEPGGAPVKCGVPLSDFCAGLYGAYAIAAVLRRVQQGGAGEHVDVSMLGSSLAVAALQTSEYFGTGRDPAKLGSAHPRNAPYRHSARRTTTSPWRRATTACSAARARPSASRISSPTRASPRPRCARSIRKS
jgi:crotonobetainyl-CoA:carnitine CoA-transferase CaiB-like acyl-CoA transferase